MTTQMGVGSTRPWSFLLYALILLECVFHGSFARELAGRGNPNNNRTAQDHGMDALHDHDDDGDGSKEIPHQHIHAHRQSSSPATLDPSLHIFFKVEDIRVGKVIPLYFPIKYPSTTPNILPREEADSIPFSLARLPYLLNFFQFPQNSAQANAMEETLKHCEFPPIKGETKFCATSLESMLENLGDVFGSGVGLKVLTTTQLRNSTVPFQNYSALTYRDLETPRMIGCHTMPYPYAVFYCHGQKGDTKLYLITLRNEEGDRIEAVGVCHMNTSHWDPNHAAFKVLGVGPGSAPVCHVFPPDDLVWVPSSPFSID
ncbi:hypothetical protein Nepgr_015274 [Nepenthes gracilis]|uniref:BURP domain-containing protein n=1 Tax=Nepenthes gracilis TaxID=150966 RepID=A0AAD3SLF4_NEPGR|nr:hypothetical protein Nepgr_015274 [Nepenthes gracilis]